MEYTFSTVITGCLVATFIAIGTYIRGFRVTRELSREDIYNLLIENFSNYDIVCSRPKEVKSLAELFFSFSPDNQLDHRDQILDCLVTTFARYQSDMITTYPRPAFMCQFTNQNPDLISFNFISFLKDTVLDVNADLLIDHKIFCLNPDQLYMILHHLNGNRIQEAYGFAKLYCNLFAQQPNASETFRLICEVFQFGG